MATNTYAGTTFKVVAAVPTTNDDDETTGFLSLTYVGGCVIQSVPAVGQEWAEVTENLVCAAANITVKGSSSLMAWEFPVSVKVGDAGLAILRTAEQSRTAVISCELALPGELGTIYVQAQVAKFTEIDGGGQDDIVSATVKLLPQAIHVHVPYSA